MSNDHQPRGGARMTTDPHPSTHDWHVGTDGMELLIRRDDADTVGVHLGHENVDDAHATVVLTSRLLEMIESTQPGAMRAHLSAHSGLTVESEAATVESDEPTDAEVEAAANALADWDGADWHAETWDGEIPREAYRAGARRALSAARAVGRDAR